MYRLCDEGPLTTARNDTSALLLPEANSKLQQRNRHIFAARIFRSGVPPLPIDVVIRNGEPR
jgi:hypothetical protein